MDLYVVGQCWVNDAELQLGLGTLIAQEGRTLTLMFAAAEETRTYVINRSPLSRVRFEPGEEISDNSGIRIVIEHIEEKQGLLSYRGRSGEGNLVTIPEIRLDPHTSFSLPNQRLFTGQIDRPGLFELRRKTMQLADHLAHSELRGLIGSRTALIPHQLYIAHEVAKRHAPRVLLADEVGLGKTIEAGLILKYQLTSGRTQRALILVPETLVHQWLVEMLRRFNLRFSLFDEDRIIDENGEIDLSINPFDTEQLIICSLDFLVENPIAHQLACAADWDLLIVDEAHHLEWTETDTSPEYEVVERLSEQTKGLLLLTATPEQLGKSAHFARLRLLDPNRFHSFDSYLAEEKSYGDLVATLDQLEKASFEDLGNPEWQRRLAALDEEIASEAKRLLEEASLTPGDIEIENGYRTDLVDHLLDRHGTGRVLFRNTRNTIKGFPGRVLKSYPLACPEAYRLEQEKQSDISVKALLHPELLYQLQELEQSSQSWTEIDPRVNWLLKLLENNRREKFLVIAASALTALDLAETIRMKTGEPPAVFHEDMSIVERDRAAAYFADSEYGSQSLVCSEIGSEGRNFQFAHHLILFDLPTNPDLLEQRIGRLDRIGQTETIKIHLPYLANTAQEVLFKIYQQGTNAFEHISVAALKIFNEYQTEIEASLRTANLDSELIQKIRLKHDALEQEIHAGRDRLLEYNSCRPTPAKRLIAKAKAEDEDASIQNFLQEFCELFGIEYEPQSNQTFVLRPSENMLAPLPELPDEGMTITYDRKVALAQEDVHFVTEDHPLLVQAMDSILTNESGSTSAVAISYRAVPKGTLMVECIFVLEGISGRTNQSTRYLANTSIRTIVDQEKRQHPALTSDLLEKHRQPIKKSIAAQLVASRRSLIETLLDRSKTLASEIAEQIKRQALERAKQDMQAELDRLQALRRVNPNVREAEITHQRELFLQTLDTLGKVNFKLDAIRVLVNT